MRILKEGTVVKFYCTACDCRFVVGIHQASEHPPEENYYVGCPVCGTRCHADARNVEKVGTEEKE